MHVACVSVCSKLLTNRIAWPCNLQSVALTCNDALEDLDRHMAEKGVLKIVLTELINRSGGHNSQLAGSHSRWIGMLKPF